MMESFVNKNDENNEFFIQDLERLKQILNNLQGSINEKTFELFSITIILLNRLYETVLTRTSPKRNLEENVPEIFESDIFTACKTGNSSCVKYLIDVVGLKVDQPNEEGETLLHIASQIGNLPLVSYLISKGANKEAVDKNGNTPLHYACLNGHLHVVNYLIEKCGVNKNPLNNQKETPFIMAFQTSKTIIKQD